MPPQPSNIGDLIPHEPPMVLIDRIDELLADKIRAVTLLSNHPSICGPQGADGSWSLEIAAQACAAIIGKHYQERGYREGRLIKAAQWSMRQPNLPTESEIIIEATLSADSDVGAFIFSAELRTTNTVLAGGQLTILAK